MHKSTGHKLYGVLFSLLSGKSSSPPSPLLLPSPLLQSTYIKDWNTQSCTKARSPKTAVAIIPLFWVPSPTGKVTTSCGRDTVNIKAVYCHLWSSIFDISIQKKKKKRQSCTTVTCSHLSFQKKWAYGECLKVKIYSWKWMEGGSSRKQINKNICLQEEKKTSSVLQAPFQKVTKELTYWIGFSTCVWFSHRLLKMEEFFPESFRLDLKDERNAFSELCKGEQSSLW